MKVVYNWLKDFVDVTATPQELASRLALSGTNIGGVQQRSAWRGDRSRSQFESSGLSRPLRNRPRSRSDLQAPAETRCAETAGKPC